MIVNKMRHRLDVSQWQITLVDRDNAHHYQPGYLFLPFGADHPEDVTRSRKDFVTDEVNFLLAEVDRIDADAGVVSLTSGRSLSYDYLVIASGVSPRPGPDAWDAGSAVAPEHFRLLHPRRSPGARQCPRGVRRRPCRGAHHRSAHQVPGCAAGVHLPGGCLLPRARDPKQGRPGVRHPVVRRIHQADRLRKVERHAGRAESVGGGGFPRRAHRPGCEKACLL